MILMMSEQNQYFQRICNFLSYIWPHSDEGLLRNPNSNNGISPVATCDGLVLKSWRHWVKVIHWAQFLSYCHEIFWSVLGKCQRAIFHCRWLWKMKKLYSKYVLGKTNQYSAVIPPFKFLGNFIMTQASLSCAESVYRITIQQAQVLQKIFFRENVYKTHLSLYYILGSRINIQSANWNRCAHHCRAI